MKKLVRVMLNPRKVELKVPHAQIILQMGKGTGAKTAGKNFRDY